ncbi:MAG: LCP family protein, partial [Actinobacteria bacterium]|nr:LCP family protein [Actinomycetota bacterium]
DAPDTPDTPDTPDAPEPAGRRTWPQRILIGASVFFALGLIYASGRLDSFEEAIGSIVRIDVPTGVLADPHAPVAADNGTGVRERPAVKPGETPAGPARNFLIIGTDSAVGLDDDDPAAHRDRTASAALADVIMLLRLDPGLRRASLVSVPRDLYVPIWRGGVPVREEKIASSLLVGGMEQGAPTLVETITNNFGVPIHNFVVMDFHGFEQVVDELGGVPAWFPYPVRDVGSGLNEPYGGCTLLDGQESLAFVRSRKIEGYFDGRWRRVGVWNDLERNQRQQSFMLMAMERAIDKGARSVLVRNDLIEAGAATVVLDDRLTLRTLLDLGRAFSSFKPDDLDRYVLPVLDDSVGNSSVLRLGDNAARVFDVFRGTALQPEDVVVSVVDGRGVDDEPVPPTVHLGTQGFSVNMRTGPIAARTTIRAAIADYDAAVLLGRYIRSVPVFDFRDDLGLEPGTVELRMGTDFSEFLTQPHTFEATDAVARDYLPGVLIEQAAKPAPRRALQDEEATTTTTTTTTLPPEESTTTTTLPPEESTTTTTLPPEESTTTTTLPPEETTTTTLAPEESTTTTLAPDEVPTTTLPAEILPTETTTTLLDGETLDELVPEPDPDAYNLSPILDARPPAGVKC